MSGAGTCLAGVRATVQPVSSSVLVMGCALPVQLQSSRCMWYDLPSLRKEAVITVTFSFEDDDGKTFQKTADFRVAP